MHKQVLLTVATAGFAIAITGSTGAQSNASGIQYDWSEAHLVDGVPPTCKVIKNGKSLTHLWTSKDCARAREARLRHLGPPIYVDKANSIRAASVIVGIKPTPHITKITSTTPSPSPSPIPVGSVVATITWQYNNYVGTKPDVGALTCLISRPLKKITAEDAAHAWMFLNRSYGWTCVKADGNGIANFDAVPIGEYYAAVLSEKTTRDFKSPLRPDERAVLGIFYDGDQAIDAAVLNPGPGLRLHKWHFEVNITVRPSSITHFSYDFGNTYY